MRRLDRIAVRRALLLAVASLPFLGAAPVRGPCDNIPPYERFQGVTAGEGLDGSQFYARYGFTPNVVELLKECSNTGAGGAPACPNVAVTPLETRVTGPQGGTNVDAKVVVVNSQGFRVDWSFSEHPDGSLGPSPLVPAQVGAEARFGSRYFFAGPGPNGIEVSATDVQWGGLGTVLRDCALSVTVQGSAPVTVPTDGTPTIVPYDASAAPSGVPVEYQVSCTFDLPADCANVPAGTPCNLVAPPFDLAGHLAVEIGPPRLGCRSDAMCDAAAPFCVSGTCRDGQEGTRCSNALDCDGSLFCSGATGRCVDGGAGDACQDDLDCPNAQGCASLTCRDGNEGDFCDSEGDCSASSPFCVQPPGQFTGFCHRGALGSSCADASDCGLGLDCLGPSFNKTCVQCASDADCASGGSCLGGVCALAPAPVCASNANCTAPEVCSFQGLGQPMRCRYDCFLTNPCTGAGETCAGDRCLECVADTDCGPGRMCLAERCVP
jgi:Cys-rich repeat protein